MTEAEFQREWAYRETERLGILCGDAQPTEEQLLAVRIQVARDMEDLSNRRLGLSVRQPWAWLIVNGFKPIENRDWPTRTRGRVWIHAGKTMTKADYEACRIFVAGFSDIQIPPMAELPRGGLVGATSIVDCVDQSASPWFVGKFGFVLADSKPLPLKECNGALGFFRLPEGIYGKDGGDDASNSKLSGGGPLSNKTTEADTRRPLE